MPEDEGPGGCDRYALEDGGEFDGEECRKEKANEHPAKRDVTLAETFSREDAEIYERQSDLSSEEDVVFEEREGVVDLTSQRMRLERYQRSLYLPSGTR